jgi:hypothetical protein
MHDIQNIIYRILETTVNDEIENIGGGTAGGTRGWTAGGTRGDGASGGTAGGAAVADRRRAVESFLKLARRFNFNTEPYQERLS